MARLVGPTSGPQLAYQIGGDNRLTTAGSLTATVYSDAGGTVLADILTVGGAPIAGSVLTIGSDSTLPLFQFPDGADTVYVSVNGGPLAAVYARGTVATGTVISRGAWAAGTAYAVNDQVTFAGELLQCTTAHTSASTFSLTNWSNLTGKPGQYNVMLYGAKKDGRVLTDVSTTNGNAAITSASAGFTSADVGKVVLIDGGGGGVTALRATIQSVTNSTTAVLSTTVGATLTNAAMVYGTDDTNAINTAKLAGDTWARTGAWTWETYFPPGIYMVDGPLIQSATYKGNSQIPLTLNAKSNPTLVPVFRSPTPTAHAMFGQTVPQYNGAVIVSTIGISGSIDATWGMPSVIGGPTPQQGFGNSTSPDAWSNVMPVFDGVTIVTPFRGYITGLDLRGCSKTVLKDYLWGPFTTVATMAANYPRVVSPDNSWAGSVYMPTELNNAHSVIGSLVTYGAPQGPVFFAHCNAQQVTSIYCRNALFVGANGNDRHGVTILQATLESCQTLVDTDGVNANVYTPLFIGMLDAEGVGFYGVAELSYQFHIRDTSSSLGGTVYLNDNTGTSAIKVTGAANLEIIAVCQNRGNVTPPSVPASTTALVNPFWRHADVLVSGGTVTNISVDGTTWATSTPAAIPVPSGKAITLTYSVAPTWKWVLK